MKLTYLFFAVSLVSCNEMTGLRSNAGGEVNSTFIDEENEGDWVGQFRWCELINGDSSCVDNADLEVKFQGSFVTLDLSSLQEWSVTSAELIPDSEGHYRWGGGKIKYTKSGNHMRFCYTDKAYNFVYSCTDLYRN